MGGANSPEPVAAAASAQEQNGERTQTKMEENPRQGLKRIEADTGWSTPGRKKRKQKKNETCSLDWKQKWRTLQIWSRNEIIKGKQQHMRDEKFGFSIKIQHDYTESTEVTALPPSFDLLKEKSCSWHNSTLSIVKMKLESGKEPHPFRVLFIGPSKRLNDYYALRA
jgi:hypothetical protein